LDNLNSLLDFLLMLEPLVAKPPQDSPQEPSQSPTNLNPVLPQDLVDNPSVNLSPVLHQDSNNNPNNSFSNKDPVLLNLSPVLLQDSLKTLNSFSNPDPAHPDLP
jgi:hypothetical protein